MKTPTILLTLQDYQDLLDPFNFYSISVKETLGEPFVVFIEAYCKKGQKWKKRKYKRAKAKLNKYKPVHVIIKMNDRERRRIAL